MTEAEFAKLPDLIGTRNANRLAKSAMVWILEKDGPVKPKLGFTLVVSFDPEAEDEWQIAGYQQSRIAMGNGVMPWIETVGLVVQTEWRKIRSWVVELVTGKSERMRTR